MSDSDDNNRDDQQKDGANGTAAGEITGNAATANGAGGEAVSAGMAVPQLRVLAQYIKDQSFENPNAPQSLAAVQGQKGPDVSINVDVKARDLGNGGYECMLHISASAKRDDKTLFIAELAYGGLFAIENVPAESMQQVLLIEAPRTLFPFARRILADMTRDGGFMPLLLDPVDFAALFRQQMMQRKPATDGGDSPTVS
ncbi:MAG: protein-export chaperone SecB [Alphaproteobacteria bacterium]